MDKISFARIASAAKTSAENAKRARRVSPKCPINQGRQATPDFMDKILTLPFRSGKSDWTKHRFCPMFLGRRNTAKVGNPIFACVGQNGSGDFPPSIAECGLEGFAPILRLSVLSNVGGCSASGPPRGQIHAPEGQRIGAEASKIDQTEVG